MELVVKKNAAYSVKGPVIVIMWQAIAGLAAKVDGVEIIVYKVEWN
jgi:hypothetical protein